MDRRQQGSAVFIGSQRVRANFPASTGERQCRTGVVCVPESAVLLCESGWEMAADFYDGGFFRPYVGVAANADQRRALGACTNGAEWTGQYRPMLGGSRDFM